MLSKGHRLTARDIESLGTGKSVFGTLLSVRVLPSSTVKLGVSASKKSFPRAVDRNSVRRKVFRATKGMLGFLPPVYALIVPKKECLSASEADIGAEIQSLFKRSAVR